MEWGLLGMVLLPWTSPLGGFTMVVGLLGRVCGASGAGGGGSSHVVTTSVSLRGDILRARALGPSSTASPMSAEDLVLRGGLTHRRIHRALIRTTLTLSREYTHMIYYKTESLAGRVRLRVRVRACVNVFYDCCEFLMFGSGVKL